MGVNFVFMRLIKMRPRSTSIYTKMIIAFIIATLPIYLLAAFLYNWSTTIIKKDITDSAQIQSTNYMKDLDNEIKRLAMMQNQLFNNDFLEELVNTSDTVHGYRKIELILNIRAQLLTVKNSNDDISDVRIYLPTMKSEISAVTGYGELNPDIITPDKLTSNYQLRANNGLLLMDAYPEYRVVNGMPDLIVEIELAPDVLKKTMVSSIQRDYTGAIQLRLNGEPLFDETINEGQKDWFKTGSENKTGEVTLHGQKFLLIHAKSTEFDIMLDHYIRKDLIFEKVNQIVKWTVVFFILTVLVIALYLIYINRTIRRPLVKIVRAFRHLEEGNFEMNIQHDKNDEFQYIYGRFNEMLENLKSLIEQVYKQEILIKSAELKQLQSQINPHFLYNCLFSVIRMIKLERTEQSVHFMEHLAHYFQFITRNARDTVRIEDEIAHARNYSVLQLARFSDRISVEFSDVPDDIRGVEVPRLILQPLVENAFLHGLEDKLEDGLFRVSVTSWNDRIVIDVEDNGDNGELEVAKMNLLLEASDEGPEVTAILNVHRRLKFKYGETSGLAVSRSELGGVKVSMTIQREVSLDEPNAHR
ncbi:histidine kinase [Paenibacillus lupini]